MAIEDLRRGGAAGREPAGIAVLPPRRERLAIVSTRNRLCGIAAYTAALERQLADIFDLAVFDLDQYLLCSRRARVRELGDRHIKEICREIAKFDAVSLQLEFGTLGYSTRDIYRRFCWIVGAARRLSVTFHSFKRPPAFPGAELTKAVLSGRWQAALDIHSNFVHDTRLSLGIGKRLRRAQRRKPVSVIVHNRHDRADAVHLHGLQRVYDHPLAFLSPAEAEAINNAATRDRFPILDRLSPDAVLIGVFGFLNNYKGFESVIRALHHLPKSYHLLIFGGTHPAEILLNRPLHPYIAELLQAGNVDATLFDQILANSNRTGVSFSLDIQRQLGELLAVHPRDLSDRLHFMGALDDVDFLLGMAICDVAVLPYLEVGQSSSGPISLAVELGRRVIASRTHTFLQFAAYHPNAVEFFDIGNHLELAERIASRPQYAERAAPKYNVETNKAIYLAANSLPNPAPRPRRMDVVTPRERVAASGD